MSWESVEAFHRNCEKDLHNDYHFETEGNLKSSRVPRTYTVVLRNQLPSYQISWKSVKAFYRCCDKGPRNGRHFQACEIMTHF